MTQFSRRVHWMQRIADEVAQGIAARVASGELRKGEPIGSKAELAGVFVTTESIVDRALEALLDDGTLARTGDGTIVAGTVPQEPAVVQLPTADDATIEDIVAVLELREGIETTAAGLAAERADAAAVAAIRAAAEAHATAASAQDGVPQADFRFHLAIAEASGNPYLRDLLSDLGPLLIPRMRIAIPVHGGARDENIAQSLTEHAAIVAAIESHEAAAARAAMSAHLMRAIGMMRRRAH